MTTSSAPNGQHDPRVAQMLALFESGTFDSPREVRRARMNLVLWVMRSKVEFVLKRALDMSVALIALILASPLMLLTALAIRIDSPGPIFFKQVRVGYRGRTFGCYKFRSMYIDAERRKAELMAKNEADGPVFKMRNDPRITNVGRIIRKLSIDELPQLINVLRGEMSLVGPRPAVPKEVVQYEFDQLRRLDAIPGITGLQQVSGRSDLPFKRWVELDLEYIEQQSIWKDIEILLRTIPAVVLGKGAY
jgi:exopolysaccharide biosynthesis polyprenyl glycosylphosphotransferase